jgi:hypothetical protein
VHRLYALQRPLDGTQMLYHVKISPRHESQHNCKKPLLTSVPVSISRKTMHHARTKQQPCHRPQYMGPMARRPTKRHAKLSAAPHRKPPDEAHLPQSQNGKSPSPRPRPQDGSHTQVELAVGRNLVRAGDVLRPALGHRHRGVEGSQPLPVYDARCDKNFAPSFRWRAYV